MQNMQNIQNMQKINALRIHNIIKSYTYITKNAKDINDIINDIINNENERRNII